MYRAVGSREGNVTDPLGTSCGWVKGVFMLKKKDILNKIESQIAGFSTMGMDVGLEPRIAIYYSLCGTEQLLHLLKLGVLIYKVGIVIVLI